jgi:hypothetical protein
MYHKTAVVKGYEKWMTSMIKELGPNSRTVIEHEWPTSNQYVATYPPFREL